MGARVLIVTPNLQVGGMEKHIFILCKHVLRDATVVSLSDGSMRPAIETVARVLILPGGRLLRYWRLYQLCKEFDIVHNHANPYGLVCGKLAGCKTLETVHNSYDWLPWWQRIHYALTLRCADVICTYCEEIAQYTEKRFHVTDVLLYPQVYV
jgi:hypothetical protein